MLFSSSGWYRGEQDTGDQVVPVKEHTRVEQMTGVRGLLHVASFLKTGRMLGRVRAWERHESYVWV